MLCFVWLTLPASVPMRPRAKTNPRKAQIASRWNRDRLHLICAQKVLKNFFVHSNFSLKNVFLIFKSNFFFLCKFYKC